MLHGQTSARGKSPPNSVPAQETAKRRARFGWPPVTDVAAVTKARRETRCNLLGCPKLPNRFQPLADRSSPSCGNVWRIYLLLLNKFFFRLSIHDLVAKIQPDKVVRWCAHGDFLRHFASRISSEPRAAHFRPAF